MLFSALTSLLLLIPFVAAEGGVHKLKLKKLPYEPRNPALESLYLSHKYGAPQSQLTLSGAGAGGLEQISRPLHNENGEDLFWTQEGEVVLEGGHKVPLSSMLNLRHFECILIMMPCAQIS